MQPALFHPRRLIVALDLPTRAAAMRAMSQLPPGVCVKVGLELFTSEGPSILQAVADTGRDCFLDLKFHDIPHTVEQAVRAASKHHVFMLTVHAQGGQVMLRAAAKAAAEAGTDRPLVVAVTTLTSMAQDDLTDIGVGRRLAEHTIELGRMAITAGADGLVCSPQEIVSLRSALGSAPILVTPGVRPAGAALGDQKRVATPQDAMRAGASFLVMGRPILDAPDPRSAAEAVLAEMRAACQP